MIGQFVTLVSPNWYCPSSAPSISSRVTVWSLSDISFNCWAFRTPYLDQKDMTPLRPLSTLSNICTHTQMDAQGATCSQYLAQGYFNMQIKEPASEPPIFTTWATALQNRRWFKHIRFKWPPILIDHELSNLLRFMENLWFKATWREISA